MHGVERLRRGIRGALAHGVDLRQPGAVEDVGIALAQCLVVAAEEAAAARQHACVASAEQRRALVVGGELGEPGDDRGAGIVDRHAGCGGVGRAAGDAGIRQIGGARHELELLEVEAEPIGGDLGERGPGALPHVVRPRLHQAGAVAAQHRPSFGLEHQRREGRGAQAPADEHPRLVAHLPGRERTARPAEALGALGVAFAQGLRGERLAGDRLDLGIVLQAERQRVHAAGRRRLVDRALQRDRAGRFAGRPHEQRRPAVEPHHLVGCGDGGAGIERVRDLRGGLEEIVEAARCRPGVVVDRRQPALTVGGDAEALASRCAMAYGAIHLLAAQHQLDWPADQPGRQNAEQLRPGDEALGAEAAAEERAANMDIPWWHAEQSSDPRLGHGEALARRIDRQCVAVPSRDNRVRLHRIVILR